MPELPDVELFKRHLDTTCLGRTICQVTVNDARILSSISADELGRRLDGVQLAESRRHGKHLLVGPDPPGWLTMHFGMNGSLRHFAEGENDPPYDRVRFDFSDGHHLAYVNPRLFGQVGLASDAAVFIAEEGLGPDALDPRFDLAAFERALAGRKRDVKSLLMDQAVIAGIGNIYSDEILFQAGVHPRARSDRLSTDAKKRLFSCLKEVLQTAVDAGAGAERLVDRLPKTFFIPIAKRVRIAPDVAERSRSSNFQAALPITAHGVSPSRGEPTDNEPDPMPTSTADPDHAPGAPGINPTWTSSAKDLVGCALGPSRLWFTIGFGIINEVYYPRVDIPQIRDLGFIVGGPDGFWSEVKRNANYRLRPVASGVPAVEIRHEHPRYVLHLRVTPDPRRDVLLIDCVLEADNALRPYVLLAPHLGATGYGNVAAAEHLRGRHVLWAEQGPFGLALAAADEDRHDALGRTSTGYVGTSDGWQDFARHGAMTWEYAVAGPGNVALIGELQRQATLALGFGSSAEAAATLAISSLMQPFDAAMQQQIADWEAWQARCSAAGAVQLHGPADLLTPIREQFATSAVVLRAHLDKTYPGAMVASLSVPWGDTGNERGGYHLVWPRDLVECAGALLALGAESEAGDTLRYLIATQNEDGHWHQNQWLGGTASWSGIQLDESAFPVLLAAALADRDRLRGIAVEDMVRRALGFIARTGPSTAQDRWEENEGINGFTLAVSIAALVAGAELLPSPASDWALALADFWNAEIEAWTVVANTALAQRFGVPGYYVRVAPQRVLADRTASAAVVPIRNRSDDLALPAEEQVGTEFLQLVRFGLRRADDPMIRASVRVIDALLKTDTPNGPVWHRYRGDGYGEHEDGRAFDGTGCGRGWPLLTGERGHYELCAGNDPLPFLKAMAAMTSPGGMMPEQVWDADPIPQRRLFPGLPSGSAMPLAWAHAEFVKLLVSRQLGRPFDRPLAVWRRYGGRRPVPRHAFWWPHAAIGSLPAGASLAIALDAPALVHWGYDGWRSTQDAQTNDTGLSFHVATLQTGALPPGTRIDFTWRREDTGEWHGKDEAVATMPPPALDDCRTSAEGARR